MRTLGDLQYALSIVAKYNRAIKFHNKELTNKQLTTYKANKARLEKSIKDFLISLVRDV